MATGKSPIKDTPPPPPSKETPSQLHESSPNPPPTTPTTISESHSQDPPSSAAAATDPRPPPTELPQTPSLQPHITIPSYARWFSWNEIHDCEIRFLPEFFDGRSPSKNPSDYKYYRNSIVKAFRENPTLKITFTDVRKTIVGDVGSIRRVFDFLDEWGLINYTGAAVKQQPVKWDDKERKSSVGGGGDAGGNSVEPSVTNRVASSKKFCSGCKSLCSIACFASDKYDLTLCARCYVRGNYRVGVSSDDFRRVEISDDSKTNWTDIETLRLLEAAMHYGDDWKRVAQHVGGRSDKECVARFVKLPFGEQFVGNSDSGVAAGNYQMEWSRDGSKLGSSTESSPTKRMCLTPLADASNPIMAQVAFLSALAGEEIAKAAAQAAITALSEVHCRTSSQRIQPLSNDSRQRDSAAASDVGTILLDGAAIDAASQLEKEECDVERAISGIAEVEMKEIWEKIARFEEFDLQMEKEWQQLQQLENMLFVDQLSLLFHKRVVGERKGKESLS